MIVSVSKWDDGVGVPILEDVANEIGLRDGLWVDVRVERGGVVISKLPRRYTLEELVANLTPEGMREAFDWGSDVGREIVDD